MKETKKDVEVLITTMYCDDFESLLKKMNIQTMSMIGNQGVANSIVSFDYGEYSCKVYSFCEKGVGLNRNNLLMRSYSKYCLFGDDDVVYKNGYENIVSNAFEKHTDADVIVFNLEEEIPTRFVIEKDFKVSFFNFMRFGAARIAVRTKCIQTHGILFNTCFGGGALYSHGEDTLFLNACLKAGLHIYAVNQTIGELVQERDSTWFQGYDEKYFLDKGLLYYLINRKIFKILILQDCIRHKGLYNKSIFYLYKTMKRGVQNKKRKKFE